MTKISNQIAYIPDTDINGKDYLLGTDIDKGKNTSNFRVEDLGKYFNSTKGIRSFDYSFYNHIGISPTPNLGGFYSNDNNTNPFLINYFILSKKTKSDLDVYSFFQGLVLENPFNLVISQNIDINTVFYFKIDSIEINANYIKLNVSRVFFPENKELEYGQSFTTFNLKSSASSGASYTDEEAQDAVGNILIDSDTIDLEYDDNLPSIKATVISGSITANELATNIPTSEFINDGSDGTSTYVETDELADVATSGDYTDLTGLQLALDNKQDTLTEDNFGAFSESLTEKTTIVDADKFNITDSSDSNKQKKFSFANLKVSLTTFFNGLFAKVNLDATTITSATVVINADTTKFNVNIVGKIVNPLTGVVTNINKVQTGIVATHLAAQTESYIWVDATSTVIQSLVAPTEDMFDNILGSWVLVHSNLTNINLINDFAMTTDGVGMQLNQVLAFDGFRKKLNSNLIQSGTTGTRLTHTGGLAIKSGGGGMLTKRPVFNLVGATDATFRMRNRGASGEGADTQTMDVTNIDIGDVTTTLSNNKFGAHKVWKFSSSLIRVQRGQKEYANINDALTGIDKDVYVDNSNGSRNGIAIGWVIFKKGTTWAGGTNGVDYKFVDIVGGKSSGGGFIANMQSVYDVSVLPHIKTILAFTLQGNTGLDTDKIFSGKNNAGTETSWIAADGTSSFISKDISALTSVSLPLLDTDKLIVNRGGVDYSVDKSELGGGGTKQNFVLAQSAFGIFPKGANVWVSQAANTTTPFYINDTTSQTDINLLTPSSSSWVYQVPIDCYVKDIRFYTNGSTSAMLGIIKSNKLFGDVEIIKNIQPSDLITGRYLAEDIAEDVLLSAGDFIHVFGGSTSSGTSTIWCRLSIIFKPV